MARWQPPIPADMLYSAPARKLGAGIVLLLWCYDGVDRSTGVVKVSLAEATDTLEESYHTVKKWWHALRAGPFFTEVKDCGRKGFEATFNPDWIDWRQMNRERPVKDSSSAAQVPPQVLESGEQDVQGALKDSSRTNEVPVAVLETSAYKVPNTPDQTHVAPVASDDAPAPRKRVRKPKEPPASPIEVRQAIAKGSQIDLERGLKADIVQVNQQAAHLWTHMRQPEQTVESFVADVRYVGKWIRQTQHPYKGSEQRIPPAALVKFWPAALEARTRQQPVYSNGANGTHPTGPPPVDYSDIPSPYANRPPRPTRTKTP